MAMHRFGISGFAVRFNVPDVVMYWCGRMHQVHSVVKFLYNTSKGMGTPHFRIFLYLWYLDERQIAQ